LISRSRFRKILFGWIGGLILFILTVGAGIFAIQTFPADANYNLSVDFVSFRKLEYYAKAEKEFSTPLMDVSELGAKMETGKITTAVKVSSLQAPFSDASKDLLSFFVTSEDDTNPYILFSLTAFSKSYVEIVSELSLSAVKNPAEPKMIRMKINGLNERPYFKIDLPSNEDLESVTLADALQDGEFKNFKANWEKILNSSNLSDSKKWASEILVYYSKDSEAAAQISHFLPLVLREFYE
jgi:hypothetical protein